MEIGREKKGSEKKGTALLSRDLSPGSKEPRLKISSREKGVANTRQEAPRTFSTNSRTVRSHPERGGYWNVTKQRKMRDEVEKKKTATSVTAEQFLMRLDPRRKRSGDARGGTPS